MFTSNVSNNNSLMASYLDAEEFTILPSTDGEKEGVEYFDIPKKAVDSKQELKQAEASSTLSKVAQLPSQIYNSIPPIPQEVKDGLAYANQAVQAVGAIQNLANAVNMEGNSNWDNAVKTAKVIQMTSAVASTTVQLAKGILPPVVSNATIPGSGLILGFANGVSIVNAAINTVDYLNKWRSQDAMPTELKQAEEKK